MKTSLIVLCAALASPTAWTQEIAQVLSRTPVYEQVSVPQQVCTPVATQSGTSGAGALMGAIAGGAIGQQIGGGSGQALATLAGVVGGAMLGDRIESPGTSNTLHCSVQNTPQNRLVGYQVVYTFAGKQYQTQLPYDPGPTLTLQITPVGAPPTPGLAAPAPAAVYTSPSTVIMPAPRWASKVRPTVLVQPWPLHAGIYIQRDHRTEKYRHRSGLPRHARPHGYSMH